MSKTSCISHKSSQQIAVIREDYLSMCDGNYCAAALLNIFEYWMNVKLGQQDQAKTENKIAAAGGAPSVDDSLWVYKTGDELKDELLGLFADTKITEAVKLLKAKGFISTRNNPNYGWDRTLQYLFNIEAVQHAVNISDAYTILKNKLSKPYKKRIKAVKVTDESLKNKEAIPKTTTETTSKTTTEIKDSAPIGTDPAPIAETEVKSSALEEFVETLDIDMSVLEATTEKITPPDDAPATPAPRPRNLEMDAVCIAFGVEAGGYAQMLLKQLKGDKTSKGKRLEFLLPTPMTYIEILACRNWYGTDTRYKDKGHLPQTAETIYERVLEFRAQPDYQKYMQAETAFQQRKTEFLAPKQEAEKELPPPNPEMAARVDDVINRMLRGEVING